MISTAVAAGECDLCAERDSRRWARTPGWMRPSPSSIEVAVVDGAEPAEIGDEVGPYRAASRARGTLQIRLWLSRQRGGTHELAMRTMARLSGIGVWLASWLVAEGESREPPEVVQARMRDAEEAWDRHVDLVATSQTIAFERTGGAAGTLKVRALRSLRIADEGAYAVNRYRLVALHHDGDLVELVASSRRDVIRWLHRAITDFVGLPGR
jgi:hypothetical protein